MINSLHGNEAAMEKQHCLSTERDGSEKAILLTCSLARNTKAISLSISVMHQKIFLISS